MIIQLHQNLINKIAAGEVVERPASVVKELVENAIDAKTTKIEVKIENAGKKLLEVTDNGIGMTRDDAEIACDSHTTSKITTIDDLENIRSMGFRGEALASISSVSNLTLVTQSKDEKIGSKIVINGGKRSKTEDFSTEGTTISVERLFHNIPARKKFLKTDNTEFRHILTTFHNYALSYPNIHFILTHNKKSVYNLPSINNESFNKELLVRIFDIFGGGIADNLVEIYYNSPEIQITGFTGHPKISKSRGSVQLQFLNKRPISDKLISRAVYDAYQGLVPKGKYPIFFMFITLDPKLVDVNVHPRKSEVRFEDTQQIYQAVKQSAKQNILSFLQKDTKEALKVFSNTGSSNRSFSSRTPAAHAFAKASAGRPSNSFSSDKPTISNRSSNIEQSLDFTKEILQATKGEVSPKLQIDNGSVKAFQVFNCFIIVEKEDTLLMVDQHAADERITYEQLKKDIANSKIETQTVLIPEVIKLDKAKLQIIEEKKKEIEKLGLKIAEFGKNEYRIEEVPALLAKANPVKLLEEILDDIEDEEDRDKPESFEEIEDHIIATMACHSSIRGGMKLHQEEIQDLVEKLLKCKNPYSCPHGRPVIWEITREELERKFGRP